MELQRFYKKVNLLKLTYFLVNNTKYNKAIQPLCGMELQRFYKKVNLSKLTYFLVKNTKYKATQALFGMELQRSKRLALATQSHSFKTTVILITTNIEKTIFRKKLLKFNFLFLFFLI